MSKHQTQWAAQFAAASELCKRGYDVAFTMGKQTPDADILAIGPTSKQAIKIDVKGQSSKNFWRIREKEEKLGLFYILTLVRLGQETEFFYHDRGRRPTRTTGLPNEWREIRRAFCRLQLGNVQALQGCVG